MLSFRQITLDDIPTLNAYFNAYPHRQCDRAMGSTVMWRDYFKNRFAVHNGTIILSAKLNDEICFSYPIGRNPDECLDMIDEYCKEKDIPMVLCTVNSAELEMLKNKYPDLYAETDRDWFDYLYEKDGIMNLIGRKYATPRNHINKFKKLYPNWSFEPISDSNINELIEFSKNFTFNSEKDESANLELEMCIEVLKNFEEYGMVGGVLKTDGNIVGYSIGEIIGDTVFCHIEKADISFAGAYQMLTNQFLKTFASSDDIKYVNREEDCGDEGLRKSKLSYHPCELIEKNTVYIYGRND